MVGMVKFSLDNLLMKSISVVELKGFLTVQVLALLAVLSYSIFHAPIDGHVLSAPARFDDILIAVLFGCFVFQLLVRRHAKARLFVLFTFYSLVSLLLLFSGYLVR